MTQNKTSKFGIGIALGAIAGAVAGLFLAPKSGKELQKDAKKLSETAMKKFKEIQEQVADKEPEEVVKMIFGKVSDESLQAYESAKKQVAMQLANLKENYKTVDTKKYGDIVMNAVDQVKKSHDLPEEQVKKLADYLKNDFKKLTGKGATKKVTKKKASTKTATAARKKA